MPAKFNGIIKGIDELLKVETDDLLSVKMIYASVKWDGDCPKLLSSLKQNEFDHVCHIIETCQNMSHFSLADFGQVTSENLQKLSTSLSTCKHLQEFYLIDRIFDSKSCDSSKISVLRSFLYPNLLKISLGSNKSGISKSKAENIFSLIENLPEQCPHLQNLELSNICIDQLEQRTFEAFCQIFSRLNLRALNLDHIGLNRLTDQQFELFCETLRRSEHLIKIVFSEGHGSERVKKLQQIAETHALAQTNEVTIHAGVHNNEAKVEDIFSAKPKTAAMRLDDAWKIYCDRNKNHKERVKARDDMIDLLDLHHFKLLDPEEFVLDDPTELDNLLKDLMDLRRQQIAKGNHNYIPILASGSYRLLENASELKAIPMGQKPEDPKIQQALDEQTLLDVVEQKKKDDRDFSLHKNLSGFERDKYNLYIKKGLFYQSNSQHPFSSSNYLSHNKKGFASFTMNSNGEISIFEHEGIVNAELHHSSMNAGAPVLSAGEMAIEDGKLISLTSYSGHYAPTLYSVYRFLEYLGSRGVDISETTVYLEQKPDLAITGLKSIEVVREKRFTRNQGLIVMKRPSDDDYPRISYAVPAIQIVHNNKAILNQHIQLIHQFIQENITVEKSESAQKMIEIAKRFRYEMIWSASLLKSASNYLELKIFLESQKAIIDRYQKQIESIKHNKSKPAVENKQELSLLFKKMKKDYEKIAPKPQDAVLSEEKRIKAFKKTY